MMPTLEVFSSPALQAEMDTWYEVECQGTLVPYGSPYSLHSQGPSLHVRQDFVSSLQYYCPRMRWKEGTYACKEGTYASGKFRMSC